MRFTFIKLPPVRPVVRREDILIPDLWLNTSPDGNHPFHSGDLINIEANKRGNAHLNTTTTRVTLSPGPLSLDRCWTAARSLST